MTSLSLTKRVIQGIQIKWEVRKNFCAFFFFLQILSSFHKDHVGKFDTWLSLEERNLKPYIWMSTSQSVPREMQKDTKNGLKNFYHITIFGKHGLFCEWLTSYCAYSSWGVERWGTRLRSHVIKCYWYNIKELKCSYEDTLQDFNNSILGLCYSQKLLKI